MKYDFTYYNPTRIHFGKFLLLNMHGLDFRERLYMKTIWL